MTYTDDILQAYLAGSLDAKTANALERAIADDPTLESRLMALDPIAVPIKEAFADVPPTERLAGFTTTTQKSQSPFIPLLRYAAAALIGVTVGYGVFAPSSSDRLVNTDWRDQVAAYQVLYVSETVQGISSTPEDLAAQFETAQAQLNLDLQQNYLSSIPTLDLKRAQILGFNDEPLIQIAFEGAAGTPIALCIIRNESGKGDLQSKTLAGLASAYWSTETHSFLLIGGTEQDAITKTAADLVDVFG